MLTGLADSPKVRAHGPRVGASRTAAKAGRAVAVTCGAKTRSEGHGEAVGNGPERWRQRKRGGMAPEGDGALSTVGTRGVATSMLDGLPDVRVVVGVAVVVTDGAVAVTDDTGDASMPTTRGRRG